MDLPATPARRAGGVFFDGRTSEDWPGPEDVSPVWHPIRRGDSLINGRDLARLPEFGQSERAQNVAGNTSEAISVRRPVFRQCIGPQARGPSLARKRGAAGDGLGCSRRGAVEYAA